MYTVEEPFWGKTLRRIREIWPLGDQEELKDKMHPELPDRDLNKIRRAIDACLERRGGEVSARSRAAELGRAYLVLESGGRRRFLELLAREYDVDNVAVEKALEGRDGISSILDLQNANQHLRALLDAPRTRLLQQFNELKEGGEFLVDLRAELLFWAKEDAALKHLIRMFIVCLSHGLISVFWICSGLPGPPRRPFSRN